MNKDVMGWSVVELSKRIFVDTPNLERSKKEYKIPALWEPFRMYIGEVGDFVHPQDVADSFKLYLSTAQRNLRDMEEAGWLKYSYKEGNNKTKWYYLAD